MVNHLKQNIAQLYDRFQNSESQLRAEYRDTLIHINRLELRLPVTNGHSENSQQEPRRKTKKVAQPPQEPVEPPARSARKDVL